MRQPLFHYSLLLRSACCLAGCWVCCLDFSLVVVFSVVADFFFGSSRSSLRTLLLEDEDDVVSLRRSMPDGAEKSPPDSSDVADDM